MKGYLVLAVLLLNFSFADAYEEPKLCYILDGILVVYAFILTILYFRLKIHPVFAKTNNDPRELTPHNQDTYDTIKK